MDKSTAKLLTAGERELIAETGARRLAKLDTDELLELHTRVRRARNKYLQLHRRQAGEQVGKDGSRSVAAQKNQRTSTKAEVFEDALSAVSSQLAVASKKSAAQIRKDRLAAARPEKKGAAKKGATKSSDGNRAARRGAASKDSSRTTDSSKRKGDRAAKSPASKKATASSRAAGARRQAKKDAR